MLRSMHKRMQETPNGYRVLTGIGLHLRDLLYAFKRCQIMCTNRGRSGRLLICNSYPKSGTHLLFQVLSAIPGYAPWEEIISVQSPTGVMNTAFHIRMKYGCVPPANIVRAHLTYEPPILRILNSRDCVKFFIYRDPRDVAVSLTNWLMRPELSYFLAPIYRNYLKSDEKRLMTSIEGLQVGTPFGSNVSQSPIGQDFRRWAGWLHDPKTLAIKFEDLIGHRGGGDEDLRHKTISRILDHAGLSMTADQIRETFTTENLHPEKAQTFHKGRIGSWQTHFNERHKEVFKRVAGDLLIELGYENDLNW